jgi:putative MATE family efflux protein
LEVKLPHHNGFPDREIRCLTGVDGLEENKMAVMPVRRLLLHMSWPMMLSMLIQALYNLVDSIFVAQLSGDGFVALSLAYPVQTLMIAVCVGTGVGVNSMLSRRLGEKDQEAANAVAVNGYFVYLVCWLIFLVLGLLLARPFMTLFDSRSTVIDYGTQYLSVVTALSIGMCWQFAGERVLQASGDAVGPMIIQGIGAVINLVLDPALIFGLGPFPRLEVAGAAIATVFGQLVGMTVGLVMVRRNKVVRLHVRRFRPNAAVIRDIYRIGLPAIAMQALTTVMTMGMNKVLALFSSTGVFILGAYFKLQSFIFMPVYGLNNGLIPVVSFNYGAKSHRRITGLIHFALVIAGCIMVVGTLLLLLFPAPLLRLFEADAAVLADGVPALRMVACSFVFAGLSIIFCSSFQALGCAGMSLVISLLRQVVILIPATLLLGLWSPTLMWLSFPISEVCSCLLSFFLYRRVMRTKISPLEA